MSANRFVLGSGFGLAVLTAGIVAALGTTAAVRGELAVLENGDYLKIERFELEGERMRLFLPAGGTLTLAIERIERIVEDEISEQPDESEPLPPEPEFELAFGPEARAPETPFGDLFFETGRRHELNPILLAAVARAESGFDPSALSRKGARGLLQLMPATAKRFGVEPRDLWSPEHNAEAGARYLRFLIGEFDGRLELVLAAYNAGEGAVRRYGGVPPYRETRTYVGRVLGFLGL